MTNMTNEINQESMERIARWLDGEQVTLSPQEQSLAGQVQTDQSRLGEALEGLVAPQAAIDRARRRVGAQLAAPKRRNLKLLVVRSMAAAAALLIITVAFWPANNRPEGQGPYVLVEELQQTGNINILSSWASDLDSTAAGKLDLLDALTMDDEHLSLVIVLAGDEPQTLLDLGG